MSPVFCRMLGLSDDATAYFMTATIVGGILLLWPFGRLADRLDRRRVITLACMASGLASLGIVLVGDRAPVALFVLAAVWGGCSFPIYSLSLAHTNDLMSRENLVSASSSLLLVYGVGAIFGPMLTGFAMGVLGAMALYTTLAAIMGGMVLFALHRARVGPYLPVEEQEAVVLVPRTTHVAYALDPRQDPEEADVSTPSGPDSSPPNTGVRPH